MAKAPKSITQKELAAALNMSREAVRLNTRLGMPTESVAAAKAWRAKHITSKNDTVSIGQARTLKIQLDVAAKKLDLQERQRSLIPRAEAEREAFALARAYRDSLLAWPARVAPLIAGRLGVDPDALCGELETEIERHLSELAEPSL